MAAIDGGQLARLTGRCLDAFKGLPRLIELDLPVGDSLVVVGDSHGDVDCVKAIAHQFLGTDGGNGTASLLKNVKLLFLGDYVDRDDRDLENLAYILSIATSHPSSVFLLRGNHEEAYSNRVYGFIDNLERLGLQGWYPTFEQIFTLLPLACYVRNQGVLCCHGMIPAMPGVVKLRDIAKLPVASRFEQWDPVTTQLLWNDPDVEEGYSSSENCRGAGLSIGQNDLEAFMVANQLRLIIRSHQAFPAGYRFFFQKRVLSVFSKPNYGMGQNAASIARLHGDGRVDILSKASNDQNFTIVDTFKLG
ncbi:MAG: metallophosphoesterase [Candidatus Lokiarchaeota archaeon]|nr:metallophosphoesterase [Candidatus Lokiarchaeota archaeon]